MSNDENSDYNDDFDAEEMDELENNVPDELQAAFDEISDHLVADQWLASSVITNALADAGLDLTVGEIAEVCTVLGECYKLQQEYAEVQDGQTAARTIH